MSCNRSHRQFAASHCIRTHERAQAYSPMQTPPVQSRVRACASCEFLWLSGIRVYATGRRNPVMLLNAVNLDGAAGDVARQHQDLKAVNRRVIVPAAAGAAADASALHHEGCPEFREAGSGYRTE